MLPALHMLLVLQAFIYNNVQQCGNALGAIGVRLIDYLAAHKTMQRLWSFMDKTCISFETLFKCVLNMFN